MGSATSASLACGSDSILATRHSEIPNFKFVIVGDAEVGKTAIFLRYTRNQFDYSYQPTLAVNIGNVVKKVNVPFDTLVSVTVWDLPGREELDLRRSYYKDIDAAIVVTDLSDPDTIEMAGTWKQDIVSNLTSSTDDNTIPQLGQKSRNAGLPILLIGNKLDKVIDDNDPKTHAISTEKLEHVASLHRFIGCVTVSAKENDGGVHTALQSLIRHLLERHKIGKKASNKPVDLAPLFSSHRAINKYIQALTSVEDHDAIPLQKIGIAEIDNVSETATRNVHVIERNCIKLVLATRRIARTCCIAGITDNATTDTAECIVRLKEAIDTDCEDALKCKDEDGLMLLWLEDEKLVTPILKKIVEIYRNEVLGAYQIVMQHCPKAEALCRESIVTLTTSNVLAAEEKAQIKLDKAQRRLMDTNVLRLRTTVTLANKAIEIVTTETKQIEKALL